MLSETVAMNPRLAILSQCFEIAIKWLAFALRTGKILDVGDGLRAGNAGTTASLSASGIGRRCFFSVQNGNVIMPKRIVLLTAGGHISAFHAAFSAIAGALERNAPGQYELLGARGGVQGLLDGDLVKIHAAHIEPDRAGSMIGADRYLASPDQIKKAIRSYGIHAIVIMGGDNHMGEMANLAGASVVGYPKTMDGDLNSFISLGWHTAVTVGAQQTRWHHHCAMTNSRVFFVGLFGRNTDWTLCGVTAYGGGDLGIPCEAEYHVGDILTRIQQAVETNRQRYGIGFAVVPYSEGMRLQGISEPLEVHSPRDVFGQPKLQPEWIGMELVRLAKQAGLSAAFQVHSYDLRDSPPTSTDQRLSRMAGEECVAMILEQDFGQAVIFEPDGQGFYRTARRPISQVAKQRALRPLGFFDYDKLKPLPKFHDTYGDLFRDPLGTPPCKDSLVYQNLRP